MVQDAESRWGAINWTFQSLCKEIILHIIFLKCCSALFAQDNNSCACAIQFPVQFSLKINHWMEKPEILFCNQFHILLTFTVHSVKETISQFSKLYFIIFWYFIYFIQVFILTQFEQNFSSKFLFNFLDPFKTFNFKLNTLF